LLLLSVLYISIGHLHFTWTLTFTFTYMIATIAISYQTDPTSRARTDQSTLLYCCAVLRDNIHDYTLLSLLSEPLSAQYELMKNN
jgi:hypothetical protein